MQTFKSFLDQALLIWQDSTGAARIGIILLLLICVGAIVGVGIWSAQPNYVVFRESVSNDKIPRVVAALKQANIEYQWTGSTIYVDERKLAEAEIAVDKLGVAGSGSGFTPNQSDMWLDPSAQKLNERYNLETQIAAMIKRFMFVEDATVVLSLPKYEPFIRKSAIPRASVTLEISPMARFDESQAAAIASLVAYAVPELSSDNVTIADTTGFQYTMDETFRQLSKQEQHRLNEERALAAKAQDLLIRTLGAGNAIVKVNTTFKFIDAEITDVQYDTEKKFKVTEEIESNKSTGGSAIAGGGAGTVSNNGNRTNNLSGGNSIDTTMEKIRSTTEAPRTERREVIRTPEMTAMTVSVLINSADLKDANNAIPPELKTRYESIVKNAIGFSESRGDQINVEFLDFADPLPGGEEVAAPFPWEQVHLILKNISLGLAGLVAFLLGIMAFKKLTPLESNSPDSGLVGREAQVNKLSELVKQNPEVFSQIIAAWSNASPESTESAGQDQSSTGQAA